MDITEGDRIDCCQNALYPDINSINNELNEHKIIETKEVFINDPFLSRAKYIREKNEDLKNKIKHYEKLKERWNTVDSILKSIGISLTFVLGISSSITGVIVFPPLIPIILGGLTASQASINSILVISLSSKKKAFYRSKVLELKRILDKCHVYFLKAIDDKEISDEEINNFNKIYNRANNISIEDDKPKNSLSSKDTPSGLSRKQMYKVKYIAEKEAKKDIKEEMKKKFKNEYILNAQSSL